MLLLLGGGTLIGSVFAGKLLVDAVQGDEPPKKSGRSDFEESVRLVGSLLGISVTVLQIPKAIEQAQELIRKGEVPTLPALAP